MMTSASFANAVPSWDEPNSAEEGGTSGLNVGLSSLSLSSVASGSAGGGGTGLRPPALSASSVSTDGNDAHPQPYRGVRSMLETPPSSPATALRLQNLNRPSSAPHPFLDAPPGFLSGGARSSGSFPSPIGKAQGGGGTGGGANAAGLQSQLQPQHNQHKSFPSFLGDGGSTSANNNALPPPPYLEDSINRGETTLLKPSSIDNRRSQSGTPGGGSRYSVADSSDASSYGSHSAGGAPPGLGGGGGSNAILNSNSFEYHPSSSSQTRQSSLTSQGITPLSSPGNILDEDDGLRGLGALRDRSYSSPGPLLASHSHSNSSSQQPHHSQSRGTTLGGGAAGMTTLSSSKSASRILGAGAEEFLPGGSSLLGNSSNTAGRPPRSIRVNSVDNLSSRAQSVSDLRGDLNASSPVDSSLMMMNPPQNRPGRPPPDNVNVTSGPLSLSPFPDDVSGSSPNDDPTQLIQNRQRLETYPGSGGGNGGGSRQQQQNYPQDGGGGRGEFHPRGRTAGGGMGVDGYGNSMPSRGGSPNHPSQPMQQHPRGEAPHPLSHYADQHQPQRHHHQQRVPQDQGGGGGGERHHIRSYSYSHPGHHHQIEAAALPYGTAVYQDYDRDAPPPQHGSRHPYDNGVYVLSPMDGGGPPHDYNMRGGGGGGGGRLDPRGGGMQHSQHRQQQRYHHYGDDPSIHGGQSYHNHARDRGGGGDRRGGDRGDGYSQQQQPPYYDDDFPRTNSSRSSLSASDNMGPTPSMERGRSLPNRVGSFEGGGGGAPPPVIMHVYSNGESYPAVVHPHHHGGGQAVHFVQQHQGGGSYHQGQQPHYVTRGDSSSMHGHGGMHHHRPREIVREGDYGGREYAGSPVMATQEEMRGIMGGGGSSRPRAQQQQRSSHHHRGLSSVSDISDLSHPLVGEHIPDYDDGMMSMGHRSAHGGLPSRGSPPLRDRGDRDRGGGDRGRPHHHSRDPRYESNQPLTAGAVPGHHHHGGGHHGGGPKVVFNVKFKRSQRSFILGPQTRMAQDVKVGCYVKVEADRGEDLGIVFGRVTADKFNNAASRSSYRLGSGGGSGLPAADGGGTAGGAGFDGGGPTEISPGMGGVAGPGSISSTGGSISNAADLKRIIRLATHDEVSLLTVLRNEEDELLRVCRDKVRQRNLPMTVVDAEYQFDRHKLTFFFEAEGRIDFRELVRDLFSMYKTRIWMQQLDKNGLDAEGGDGVHSESFEQGESAMEQHSEAIERGEPNKEVAEPKKEEGEGDDGVAANTSGEETNKEEEQEDAAVAPVSSDSAAADNREAEGYVSASSSSNKNDGD